MVDITKFKLNQTIKVKHIDGTYLTNKELKVVGIVTTAGLPNTVDVASWETDSDIWVGLVIEQGTVDYIPADAIMLA